MGLQSFIAIRKLLVSAVIPALLLTGCARLHISLSGGALQSIKPVARIDPGSPIAWDTSGGRIMYVRNGLRILNPATGIENPIDDSRPTGLAWSVENGQLAAAINVGRESIVRIYGQDHVVSAETRVLGSVSHLIWKDKRELLVFAARMKTFTPTLHKI